MITHSNHALLDNIESPGYQPAAWAFPHTATQPLIKQQTYPPPLPSLAQPAPDDGSCEAVWRAGAVPLPAREIDWSDNNGRRLFVLTPEECLSEAPRNYLIKGLLARGDHGAIIGQPGSGKSVLAPYIGYRPALGLDVFGCRTQRVPVLYLAAEDGVGLKMRVRALYDRLGDAPNFHLQPVPVDLLSLDSSDVGEIKDFIRDLQPGLIVIDTIARAFPGLRENDAESMARVVKVARDFTTVCESAVLSLHHPPKDSVTPRGHGVLNGDLDVTFYLDGNGSGIRRVRLGKNRSGSSDQHFTFKVACHHLGIDADNDPITTPVADPIANQICPAVHLTRIQHTAMSILAGVIRKTGVVLPASPGFPPSTKGVNGDCWRQACESQHLSTAETEKDRGRVYRKVFSELQKRQQISTQDGWVWLPCKTHPDPAGPTGEGDNGDQGLDPIP